MQRQGFPLFCIYCILNVSSINLPVKTHQDSTIQRRKTQASEHQVPAEALMIYDMVDTYRTWTSQLGPKIRRPSPRTPIPWKYVIALDCFGRLRVSNLRQPLPWPDGIFFQHEFQQNLQVGSRRWTLQLGAHRPVASGGHGGLWSTGQRVNGQLTRRTGGHDKSRPRSHCWKTESPRWTMPWLLGSHCAPRQRITEPDEGRGCRVPAHSFEIEFGRNSLFLVTVCLFSTASIKHLMLQKDGQS